MKAFAVLGLATLASASMAQVVWYNGDDDGADGFAALVGSPNGFGTQYFQYEDFTWSSAATAKSIKGTVLGTSAFTSIAWEVRTGMAVGNAGTLVTSGTTTANLTSLGAWAVVPSFTRYLMTADIGSVALTNGGSYWLGVAMVVPNASFIGGVTSTSGLNAVGGPLNNDNSIARNVVSGDVISNGGFDLSLGISASPVPEPASMAALGLGALALIRRRRASK
jgi:hypothetical protein